MEPRQIIWMQNLQDGGFTSYNSHEASLALAAPDIIRRQATNGVNSATTALPIGAIIGIAVAGSILLFVTLALIIRHRLRSRNKRKNKPHESLSDDNEEDIFEALRSTRPPEIDLGPPRSYPISRSTKEMGFNDRNIGTKAIEFQVTDSNLAPPLYGFQIMGLRDSWPLVGWGPMSGVQTVFDGCTVNDPKSNYPRPLIFPFPNVIDNAPTRLQRALSRPATTTEVKDDRLAPSRHSVNSSVTLLKRLSPNQRSMSDDQLTSILKSTSQRLKEVQRHPRSHTTSVLSQVSGAPPALTPASPQRDKQPESRERLIDSDDISYADSVRSSVLYPKSSTPSSAKVASRSMKSLKLGGSKQSLGSDISELDSLFPCPTPDLFVPVALTSPSRRRAQTHQRPKSQSLSTMEISTKVFEDDNGTNNEDATKLEEKSPKRFSNNDPFISPSTATKRDRQLLLVKSFDFENKQEIVPDSALPSSENLLAPLTPVSGNHLWPTKTKSPSPSIPSGKQVNPFHWSPTIPGSFIETPSSRPVGMEQREHKRTKTIHLSHLRRPVSVSVVLKEPENDFRPVSTQMTTGRPRRESSPTKVTDLSILHVLNEASSKKRPPSIADFHPSFNVPPSPMSLETRRASDASYSATLSFYDYYKSSDAARACQTIIIEPTLSPTPSTKKSRRLGHNFSFHVSKSENAFRSFAKPPSSTKGTDRHQTEESFPVPASAPPQTTSFDLSDFTTSSALTSRLLGPRPQPVPVPSSSVAESVSMLRRMNSEVSTYSNASIQSRVSPTIPALRGGGLSPTKSQASGTRKYLSIGMMTRSPPNDKSRSQDSVTVHNGRTHDQSLLTMDGKSNENTLSLVIPVTRHSTPEVLPLKSHAGNLNPPLSIRKNIMKQPRSVGNALLANENCLACTKPIPYLRFDSDLDGLAYRYHEHCFICTTCKQPAEKAYDNEKALYCKKHYQQKLNVPCYDDAKVNDNVTDLDGKTYNSTHPRCSKATSQSLAQNVCHESRMQMPYPQGPLPHKSVDWRGSLGLYDEMGFLRSSPNASPEPFPKTKL